MSELLAIIDEYRDAHGQPSDASIARAVGVAPQTISSWRRRGIRELPSRTTLHALALFMRQPYIRILAASLVDTGYLDEREALSLTQREVGDDDRSAAM